MPTFAASRRNTPYSSVSRMISRSRTSGTKYPPLPLLDPVSVADGPDARCGEYPHPSRRCKRFHRLEQCRLADSGVASNDQSAPVSAYRVEVFFNEAKLAPAPKEAGIRRRFWTHDTEEPFRCGIAPVLRLAALSRGTQRSQAGVSLSYPSNL